MTLTDFLLARIAEDEADAQVYSYGAPIPVDCWSPERVLAECKAKRRIVEAHAHHYRWNDDGRGDLAQMTLELLALPYADHPDYDASWRP